MSTQITGKQIKDSSITNSKLSTTTGDIGGAWTSWTPTWTNLSVGNGTQLATYTVIGKTVFFRLFLTFGSTTSITAGDPRFSLPLTVINSCHAIVTLVDTGIQNYQTTWSITNPFYVTIGTATTSYVNGTGISSTVPFTWSTGDTIHVSGFYETS